MNLGQHGLFQADLALYWSERWDGVNVALGYGNNRLALLPFEWLAPLDGGKGAWSIEVPRNREGSFEP